MSTEQSPDLHTWIGREVKEARRAVGVAGLTTLLVVPATFALFDDDRLRMSDDYAAINAGASVAILLIGTVDFHLSLKAAKGLISAGPLDEVVRQEGAKTRTRGDLVRRKIKLMGIWLLACVTLAVSIFLMALWAAIENHGPARWLAWYSWLSAGVGLATVLIATGDKLVDEAHDVLALVRLRPSAPPSTTPETTASLDGTSAAG
ncbi:hypothetical protein [Streptomyces sp. NPDC093225]|uniref:hypothetical protein n=1 Tax=Streptomyces sp. NPDC093225 TaxID=3366034 RepID=UPI00380D6490